MRPTLRHGDILILPDEVPQDAKPVASPNGRVVLAEGEATGHAHVITAPEGSVELLERPVTEAEISAFVEELTPERFLRVRAPVELTHEEHATLTIPPGEYRVMRQVEYSPGSAPLRGIQD